MQRTKSGIDSHTHALTHALAPTLHTQDCHKNARALAHARACVSGRTRAHVRAREHAHTWTHTHTHICRPSGRRCDQLASGAGLGLAGLHRLRQSARRHRRLRTPRRDLPVHLAARRLSPHGARRAAAKTALPAQEGRTGSPQAAALRHTHTVLHFTNDRPSRLPAPEVNDTLVASATSACIETAASRLSMCADAPSTAEQSFHHVANKRSRKSKLDGFAAKAHSCKNQATKRRYTQSQSVDARFNGGGRHSYLKRVTRATRSSA
eukprot:6176638-Pleurochrysis_carterae.AAC.1